MSIVCFTGTPGTGKSLHAAGILRYDLCREYPRPCICNFPLADDAPVKHPELYSYVRNEDLSTDYLCGFADRWWAGHEFREERINLVLDEVQLVFNARLWQQSGRMDFLQFLSQHRKYGYRIILIAQSVKMIDNQFRMLVEYESNHRKIESMGLVGKLASLPFRGRLFMHVDYLAQTHERLGSQWFFARKADMRMYDSYARFNRV